MRKSQMSKCPKKFLWFTKHKSLIILKIPVKIFYPLLNVGCAYVCCWDEPCVQVHRWWDAQCFMFSAGGGNMLEKKIQFLPLNLKFVRSKVGLEGGITRKKLGRTKEERREYRKAENTGKRRGIRRWRARARARQSASTAPARGGCCPAGPTSR